MPQIRSAVAVRIIYWVVIVQPIFSFRASALQSGQQVSRLRWIGTGWRDPSLEEDIVSKKLGQLTGHQLSSRRLQQNKIPLAPAPGLEIFPYPTAFFPLDAPSIKSGFGSYNGTAIGAAFDTDDSTGITTLRCNSTSSVTLSNVPYGANGSWAINFWLRSIDSVGSIEHIFSHSAVKIYYPGLLGSTNPGSLGSVPVLRNTLRAIVRSRRDLYYGPQSISYLDYADRADTEGSNDGFIDVKDGEWHMVTLTTHHSTQPTVNLHIDGDLTAQMPLNITQGRGAQNEGDAILEIGRDIFLCSDPSAGAANEGFQGRLFELTLWNQSLSTAAIKFFYEQHFEDAAAPTPTPLDSLALGAYLPEVASPSGDLFQDYANMLLKNLLSIPEPHAYFPLRDRSLQSDPEYGSANYSGIGRNVSFVQDPHIGTVLNCDKKNGSVVVLDPVEFGQEGQWSLSLWFRPDPAGLVGDQFEYLFSQGNRNTQYTSGYEANQIRLYFPQFGHPGFGVIRALVRDAYDNGTNPNEQPFLDSDGFVGQLLRSSSSSKLREGAIDLQDGNWHMISLTTLPGEPGYAMYMDGYLTAELNATTVSEAGFTSVSGGLPMELTDNILLCGRSVQNDSRGYDGQLAELLLFDNPLNGGQIEALYWLNAQPGDVKIAPAGSPKPSPAPFPAAIRQPGSPSPQPTSDGWVVNGRQLCLLSPVQGFSGHTCGGTSTCVAIPPQAIQFVQLPQGVQVDNVGSCNNQQQVTSGAKIAPAASSHVESLAGGPMP